MLRAFIRNYVMELDRNRTIAPAPARNRHGIRSIDVGRYDAGDPTITRWANLPGGFMCGELQGGTYSLHVPHPDEDGAYLIVRDADGAPGPLLVSIELYDDDDDDESY